VKKTTLNRILFENHRLVSPNRLKVSSHLLSQMIFTLAIKIQHLRIVLPKNIVKYIMTMLNSVEKINMFIYLFPD